MLRAYKPPTQAEMFHFVADAEKTAKDVVPIGRDLVQRDHFFEIQHVVDMLFAPDGLFPSHLGGEELAMEENLASWTVLSVWINDAKNFYSINASFNQKKKWIPLANYSPGQSQDPNLSAYMLAMARSEELGKRTIRKNLQDWTENMATYGNEVAYYSEHNLVAFLRNKICEYMSWKWMKTTSWTPPTARGQRRH